MPRTQMTNEFLKNGLICPNDHTRIEFTDSTFPGLFVEVRSTSPGQGTWYLRYRNADGRLSCQKLGRTYELTLAEVRKRAKSLKAEILLGADPRADARQKKTVPTFRAFSAVNYLPFAKAHKRSWKYDETMLRLRLLPEFGNLPINKITRAHIQTYHAALKQTGLSPATCDHDLKLIKRMLSLATQWEVIDRNPATRIPLFRADNRVERYLSDEDLSKLLQVLKSHSNQVVSAIILFLLSTGARRNEALQASWSDFDLDNRVWRIPATNSKSKRIRSVPLNDTALEVLAGLPRRDGQAFLFRSTQTGERIKTISKVWGRIRKEAGLPHLRIHDLRHQYASFLVNSGRTIYEVQQILGHSDPIVTQRYSHLSTRTLQAAADSASDRLKDAALALAS